MENFIGKSFIARMRIVTPEFAGHISFSTRHEIAKSGWLIRGGEEMPAVPLRFDYKSHADDRIYYEISAAPAAHDYAGSKLGISHNGYLGFYNVASVTDLWKIELVGGESPEQGFRFYLRDSHGQRVAVSSEDEQLGNLANPDPDNMKHVDYLNVQYGEVVELEAQVLEMR